MTQVSNQKLCKGVNRNVGYYYRITFPCGTEGLTYSFKTPVDFGLGGVVYLDGKMIKKDLSDIWQGGKSTKLDFTAKLSKGNHVLELFGSEKCCDGTTRWTFKVNTGKWMDVTTKNLNMYSKPMMTTNTKAKIMVKTFKFTKNPMENFNVFLQEIKKKSSKGYCEKLVNSMTQVSNQKLCGSKVNRNIGFFYVVEFFVMHNKLVYEFNLPTDFGNGGFAIIDEKMVRQVKSTRPKDAGLSFKVQLNKGKHTMILGGAEKCCDATTAWKFRVNGADWLDFTSVNLDTPKYNPSYTEKEDDEENEFTIKKLPLAESTIMWKTVSFGQHAVNNFDEL
jgi:hypothetical protein